MFRFRYIFWLLVIIGLIILIIVLIKPHHSAVNNSPSLSSYSNTNSSVEMTIDGPEVADSQHQSVEVEVSKNSVVYTQYDGYQGKIAYQTTFANNASAYNVFLKSLAVAQFLNGDSDTKSNPELGYCALGDRYIFQLNNNGQAVDRYYATNCGKPTSYGGDLSLTMQLFQAQVPTWSTLVTNLNINT